MITITTPYSNLTEQTKELAKRWGFHYSNTPDEPFFLQLTTEHLQLIQPGKNSPGPIYIDFSSGQVAHRRRFGGGKSQTMAKAVGLNKNSELTVLDATAGMGKDAFVFASLGAKVILMERSPISAALLSDALQRAAIDEAISDIMERMSFIYGDARKLTLEKRIKEVEEVSLNHTSIQIKEVPDVIYLDPMFPHRKKSALVKKEMLAFQSLIGDDNDSDELLSTCLKLAKKRVVVKRPIKAPYLNNQKPSLSMNMKKHRFDIYVTSATKTN